MKAAFLSEYNKPLKIQEVPDPHPHGNQVVLKAVGAGICPIDLYLIKGYLKEYVNPNLPIILGHEFSGIIHDVGESVPDDFGPGDPVIAYTFYCEYEEVYVSEGNYHLCITGNRPGFGKYPGGFSEYILIPHYRYLVRADGIKDLVSAALLSDSGLRAYALTKSILSKVPPGKVVVFLGLTTDIVLAIDFLSSFGRYKLVAIEWCENPLDEVTKLLNEENYLTLLNADAKDFGERLIEATEGEAIAYLIISRTKKELVNNLVGLVAPGGTIALCGEWFMDAPNINMNTILSKGISLLGYSYGSYSDLVELAGLASKGLVDLGRFVNHVSLEEVNEVLSKMEESESVTRFTIKF